MDGRDIPNEQVDITQEVTAWTCHLNKHKVKEQISKLHLIDNGLLKHEMDEKLTELRNMASSQSMQEMEISHKLGLMRDQDVRKTTMKDRMLESKEVVEKDNKKARIRVQKWKNK